jgi:hypothetical protein
MRGVTYLIKSLLYLLASYRPSGLALFCFANKPFTQAQVLSALSLGFIILGMQDSGYSGHSFRQGAARHASDMGMLDSKIQTLSLWSSSAF